MPLPTTAVKQAERFVATIKPHGLLPGDNLVLDLEATESNGANDNEAGDRRQGRYRRELLGAEPSAPRPACRPGRR